MTTKSEVAEIQVLTDEQMNALPKDVKKNVLALTKDMRSSELVVLNPLVGRLLSLRERVASLTLEKDEEGNITPESIEEYKAIKADQRSFNGDLKREMTEIKKPYAAITKGLVAVEKKFREVSDEEVKAKAEEIFEEYEAEKKRKAEEAQKKKDAEMNAKIEEANREAEELRLKSSKSAVYNAIKYTEIAENITDNAIRVIENGNESSLNALRLGLVASHFDSLKNRYTVSLLEESVLTGLENDFYKAKASAILLIDGKLREYAEAREKLQREARETFIARPEMPQTAFPGDMHGYSNANINTGSIPPPPPAIETTITVDFRRTSNEEFIDKIINTVMALEQAVDIRIKEGVTPQLVELKHKFLKFHNND